MGAPRALAESSVSRWTTPAPSDMTKPARVASNGRDAFVGSPFAEARPRIDVNPARMSGWMQASVPPARIASAWPWRISSAPSPIVCDPVAQDVRLAHELREAPDGGAEDDPHPVRPEAIHASIR